MKVLASPQANHTMIMQLNQSQPSGHIFPRLLLVFSLVFLQSGCSLFGITTVEEAKYTILEDQGRFQVREYGALVVVETMVDTSFEQAANIAFKRLFGYISGANGAEQEIAMTTPVMALDENSSSGEKISMTAPVIGEKSSLGWRFAFVLPAGYSLENAPAPANPEVNLVRVPARKVAVVRYSGSWSEESYQKNLTVLRDWIQQNQFEAASLPRVARYDPPWTLPFLRRNEVMLDIKS